MSRPDTTPLSSDLGDTLAGGPGPEEAVMRSVVLEAALARLPPPQREALLLVTQQGLTYKEAAILLDTPIGTLKWRVHEAIQTMRELLKEGEEPDAAQTPATIAVPARTRADAPTDHLACH